jgi:subfamily B ATP-binding cassette protein MsbA
VNPLFRLLRYARPYRGRLTAALLAMILYGAASVGLVMMVKPIFDGSLFAEPGPGSGPPPDLFTIISVILILYVVKGFGAYVSSYLMTDVGQRVVRDLRGRLFRHILGQSAAFFSQMTTGRLLSRITNDVAQIQRAVSDTLGDLAREGISLVGFAGALFYYDARLALFCLTAAPLIVYPLVRLGQRVRRTTRRGQEALEVITHVSAEAFTGHRIVKAFGAEAREAETFDRAAESYYRTSMKVTSSLSLLPPLMEFIGGVAFVGALYYGTHEIAAHRGLTVGSFVAFITALFSMYGPIKKLSRVNADLQQAMAASDRIFAMFDTHSEVRERPGADVLPEFRERITYEHVGFQYEGADVPALADVTFEIGAGQTVALVGKSGAGKTTLVNLLPRFFDPTQGRIRIDGRDVSDVTLVSLRGQIGLVTQETVLFDDTIAANIAYGRPAATRAEIEASARAAHAHDFIQALDAGYETTIGERGQRLSGGQRQRLAIARAILRNSPILILDEATSSLDSESEMLVQDALSTLMLNRTSFVIAHRLSTVRRADMILVLEGGRIVERGRHDELLAAGGVYARLYEIQLQEDATSASGTASDAGTVPDADALEVNTKLQSES